MFDFFTAPHLYVEGRQNIPCIMGNVVQNRTATILGRFIFLIAALLALTYCFLVAKNSPHYPVLATLVLFVIFQLGARATFRHPPINPAELEGLKNADAEIRQDGVRIILTQYFGGFCLVPILVTRL